MRQQVVTCDRCHNQIPGNTKQNTAIVSIIREGGTDTFDLCMPCAKTVLSLIQQGKP